MYEKSCVIVCFAALPRIDSECSRKRPPEHLYQEVEAEVSGRLSKGRGDDHVV